MVEEGLRLSVWNERALDNHIRDFLFSLPERLYEGVDDVGVTLTLQKLRMLQIRGVKGEAVVNYREPLTTKEMRYPRLSQRVRNMTN